MTQVVKQSSTQYDTDFVAWSEEAAQLLAQHRFDELDLEHLIDEVRDLGNRHREALESHLTRLLMHLLKWQFQPEFRGNSWIGSIKESRKQISRLIRKYPSLKPYLEQIFEQCYQDAVEDAVDETSLSIGTFPLTCPYALDQIFDTDFLPDDR